MGKLDDVAASLKAEIDGYLNKVQLSNYQLEAHEEKFFVKTCISLEENAPLKDYIDKYNLCRDAEWELINSENLEMIKFYISKRKLSEDAQVDLVAKGNKELLLFYLKKYRLCLRAWQYWRVKNS